MLRNPRKTASPLPTLDQVKGGIAVVVPLAMAALVVADYANTRPDKRRFKKALRECGYNDPSTVLKDLDQLEPFFTAALSDIAIFRSRVEEASG